MNFKQHRNYGLTISLLASIGYCSLAIIEDLYEGQGIIITWSLIQYCIGLFIVCFFGSLAPDLDTESTPSKYVSGILFGYWVSILFAEYTPVEYELQWKPAAILTCIFLIAKVSKHRGITHALIWVPALLIASIYTGNHFLGAFAVGLVVHYYCDSINPFKLKNWF